MLIVDSEFNFDYRVQFEIYPSLSLMCKNIYTSLFVIYKGGGLKLNYNANVCYITIQDKILTTGVNSMLSHLNSLLIGHKHCTQIESKCYQVRMTL